MGFERAARAGSSPWAGTGGNRPRPGRAISASWKEVEITGHTGDLNGLDLEADEAAAADIVEQLVVNKPEARIRFIQERAAFAEPDALDI